MKKIIGNFALIAIVTIIAVSCKMNDGSNAPAGKTNYKETPLSGDYTHFDLSQPGLEQLDNDTLMNLYSEVDFSDPSKTRAVLIQKFNQSAFDALP